MNVPSFIIAGYVWQILGGGGFLPSPSHPWAAPKMPILNRVRIELELKLEPAYLEDYSFNVFLENGVKFIETYNLLINITSNSSSGFR